MTNPASTTRGRLLVVNWQDLEHPLAGGAEVHLQENLRRLAAEGFDITLLCSSFPGAAPEVVWHGVRIIRRGGRFEFNWRVPFLVRHLLRHESFDVLIEDINKIPFYTPLYQPLPVLAIVPHLFATTVFQEINFLLASYIYVCEYPVRWAYRRVPFCVISESTRTDLLSRGFSGDRIEVIHCGIDRGTYVFHATVPRAEPPIIVYVGRLKKYKCVQDLIRAFGRLRTRLPDARLVIIGDGDYRESLEGLTGRLGLTHAVRFTGFIPMAEKIRYLQEARVAVCPSLKEGWGLTNIEANACGTPVIAADVPGLRDSVRHGRTGRLYPHGDLARLEQDLFDMLIDEPLWRRYQEGALSWSARFDWDEGARRLGHLLDRLVAEGRQGGAH